MSGDPGLYGPSSVTWHLHADPTMWIAGIRALYFQALHPKAMRGVAQNSDFKRDATGRLVRTANFVGATTYATLAEAERMAAGVRRLHASMRAYDPDLDRTYRLDEPDALLWVHCTLVDSFLGVVRRAGFSLTDAHADRYVREQRRNAAIIGLSPDEAPGSVAELAAYFAEVRPHLQAIPEALDTYEFLMRPPLPAVLAPARDTVYRRLSHLAYSALPVWAHELYGKPAAAENVTTRRLRAFRRLALVVPKAIRWRYPADYLPQAIERLGRHTTPSPAALGAV
ncbi:MAG: DUF2236 domain-containing protein [Streptosporangiales bacterium]|nr:DUF2236 domain-containing protein [Streptosporangiales bacterium]